MSDDPLNRARRMLQGTNRPAAAVAPLDQSKVGDLLARARAAAGREQEKRGKMHVAPAPSAEKVRLPMTCAATGRSFIAIAERRGAALLLTDHELPQPGHRPPGPPAERLSGEYSVGHAAGWACPLCKSREQGWSCDCRECPDALHCGGRQGRKTYCACGRLEVRGLIEVASIAVRGESAGKQMRGGESPSLSSSRDRLALPGKR